MPKAAKSRWTGVAGAYDNTSDELDDYNRACAADEHLGVIPLNGGGTALVLGDEPAMTSWTPQEQLLVRWLWAEPGTPAESVVREAAATAAWGPGTRLNVPGPMQMFDSAFSGDEAGQYMTLVTVHLSPGVYETSTTDVEPDESTCFRLHQFAPVESIEPGP